MKSLFLWFLILIVGLILAFNILTEDKPTVGALKPSRLGEARLFDESFLLK